MESRKGLSDWLRYLFLPLNEEQREDNRSVLPFMIIVVLIVGTFSVITIVNSPTLAHSPRLISFITILILHLGLYFISPQTAHKRPLVLPFLGFQTALMVTLVLLSERQEMIFALIGPMIGLVMGLYRERLVMASLLNVVLLGVGALLLFRTVGEGFPLAGLIGVPIAAFVITYVIMYGRESAAKQEAQEAASELRDAHRQLIEYANRVEILAQAAERERLARELHDTLSQGLSGLVLQLEAAQSHLESGREDRVAEIIRNALVQAREGLAESRQAIAGLRKQQTPSRDLEAVLRGEIDRFTRSTGVPCKLVGSLEIRLTTETSEHLHRIVREALANITMHARATNACVRLDQAEDAMLIEIQDDGIGFDTTNDAQAAGHYGIIGMLERARLMGGTLSVESVPSRGTSVKVAIPLENPSV